MVGNAGCAKTIRSVRFAFRVIYTGRRPTCAAHARTQIIDMYVMGASLPRVCSAHARTHAKQARAPIRSAFFDGIARTATSQTCEPAARDAGARAHLFALPPDPTAGARKTRPFGKPAHSTPGFMTRNSACSHKRDAHLVALVSDSARYQSISRLTRTGPPDNDDGWMHACIHMRESAIDCVDRC